MAPLDTYINNAHNEYVQWWLEGGVVAVLAMFAAIVALIQSLHRLLRLPAGSSARTTGLAALMGVLVMLLHSSVDYPLRTPALMATFGLLAGIAISAAAQVRKPMAHVTSRSKRSTEIQRERALPTPAVPPPRNLRRHAMRQAQSLPQPSHSST